MTKRDWMLVLGLTGTAAAVLLGLIALVVWSYRTRLAEAERMLEESARAQESADERLDALAQTLQRLESEEDRSREIALDAFSLSACAYDRTAPPEGRSPGPRCQLSVLFAVRDGQRSSHHLLTHYPPENDGRGLSPDPSVPMRVARREEP